MAARRFIVTPEALADLQEIRDYLREHAGGSVANRIRLELLEAMRKLAASPGLGHFRVDLADESLRFWLVRSWFVIFRAETRPLQVVRVLHSARDVRRLLGTEETES
jgi:antitoxin ParD1/3/4/toxin ParE1/3/4